MTAYDSDQLASGYRKYVIDDHAKLRYVYAKWQNASGGTYADGSELNFCKLPPGRKRVLPNLSRYRATAMGASRVLNIGHRAYGYQQGEADEPAALNAFVSAKDVSGAVTDVAFDGGASKMKYDMYSMKEIDIAGSITGGTIPNGAIVELLLAYLYE